MATDGLSAPHAGHQLLLPTLPLAGAKIHAKQGALSAQEDSYCLQLQHGYFQLLHLQRGGFSLDKVDEKLQAAEFVCLVMLVLITHRLLKYVYNIDSPTALKQDKSKENLN